MGDAPGFKDIIYNAVMSGAQEAGEKGSRPTATKSAPAAPTARKAAAKKSAPPGKAAAPKLPTPPLTLPSQATSIAAVQSSWSQWPQGGWPQEATSSRLVDP